MSERVLIIDDDLSLRDSLALVLGAEGFSTTTAANADEALASVENYLPDVVFCDLRMPGRSGIELIPELRRKNPDATIVLMSAYGSKELALEAIRQGAYDYLAKPFQPSEALLTIRKARERERLRRQNQLLRREVERALGEHPIVAASESMLPVIQLLERAAEFKATVLLIGESGTGKEVLARTIHTQSPRRHESFVAVNCGAIPENLLESELFGHVRGAFTGADRARRGLVQEADNGSLFLDEIGELPFNLQVKLLRMLQEEEVRPLGDSKAHRVDVRIIAATSRDLEAEVRAGRFRDDLYYRLNVIRIDLPPLRERKQDIPLLADCFLAHFARSLGKSVRHISNAALQQFIAYSWPGNVRELQNAIERAVILCDGDTLTPKDLSSVLAPRLLAASATATFPSAEDYSLRRAREKFEADWIRNTLQFCEGNRTHAANLLQISYRSLLYKIVQYKIQI